MVRLLLEKGAHINQDDNYGRTPLHLAVEYFSGAEFAPEIVRLLLEKGADMNHKDIGMEVHHFVGLLKKRLSLSY